MVNLRNIGGDDVSLFAPEGTPDAVIVKAGALVDVPGVVVKEQSGAPLPDDAVIVQLPGGDLRAYATSRWELVGSDTTKES